MTTQDNGQPGANEQPDANRRPDAGGPLDGAPTGGTPILIDAAELVSERKRGMEYAAEQLEAEAGMLWRWLEDVEESGAGNGFGPSVDAMLFARLVDQLMTLCQLLAQAADRVALDGDTPTAWILLEQARQQLGHAAATAGVADGTLPPDDEVEIGANILWLIHRDLLPYPEYAAQVVDYGGGAAEPVDPRPDTGIALAPLQLMSHAVMRFGTVAAGPVPTGRIEDMAFGEYFATVLEEAMELLDVRARARGVARLLGCAENGLGVVEVVRHTAPEPWQVLPDLGRGPDAA